MTDMELYRLEARAYQEHACPYCRAPKGDWCRKRRWNRRTPVLPRHVHKARLELVA